MWVVKAKGKTFYVNHVTANIPWSTKETPDNDHTKGSIKFKNALLRIDDNNEATLDVLTPEDEARISGVPIKPTRLQLYGPKDVQWLKQQKFTFTHRRVHGSCGEVFEIVEMPYEQEVSFLLLSRKGVRILQENELNYKDFDNDYDN